MSLDVEGAVVVAVVDEVEEVGEVEEELLGVEDEVDVVLLLDGVEVEDEELGVELELEVDGVDELEVGDVEEDESLEDESLLTNWSFVICPWLSSRSITFRYVNPTG